MERRFLLSGVTLLLAACGGGSSPGSEATAQPAQTSAAVVQAEATAAPPAVARSEKESNDLYDFEYSYPAAAAAIPDLKDLLDKRLVDSRGRLMTEAHKGKQEAEADGYPYRTYAAATIWNVVTETPRFLSLSAESYVYSGGAHGMTNFDTLLWDKHAGKALQPSDLFADPASLRDAIRQSFCKALDIQRAKKRQGEDWSGDEIFSDCIDPMESTIILGSSNGQSFDRIGVLVPPYAAGPYAEGSYEVTLPVSRAVMASVKPVYRSAFAIGR